MFLVLENFWEERLKAREISHSWIIVHIDHDLVNEKNILHPSILIAHYSEIGEAALLTQAFQSEILI
jgi:hypothetical protein